MNGAGLFFLLLLLLVILPAACWVGYTRWSAHRQGLPPPPLSAYIPFKKSASNSRYGGPQPRSHNIFSWFQDKYQALRSRTAGSGYAGTTRGQRGFGPLDPDAAWDDRVGAEGEGYGGAAGYEEQELGLHPPTNSGGGPYGGSQHDLPQHGSGGEYRGRTRSREDLAHVGSSQRGLDESYDEEMHIGGAGRGGHDPFADDGGTLRGVSPRPAEMDGSPMPARKGTRKSMFRENV